MDESMNFEVISKTEAREAEPIREQLIASQQTMKLQSQPEDKSSNESKSEKSE